MTDTLEQRIQRFVVCNEKMRIATLKSEREFLKAAGSISTAQLQLILTIGQYEPCTMSSLAEILCFSRANITQMVDRLIRLQMVKKVRSKEDQRVVTVSLLAKGKKIVQLNREHVERVAADWLGDMDDVEQEAMLAMWERHLA